MKKILFCCALILAVVPQVHASNVGISVGVNIGSPAPVYVNPPVVIASPPVFVQPPQLGFFVAAGVNHDLFFHGSRYYLSVGNSWYSSPYYNGPWVSVNYYGIPKVLRSHSMNRVHYYRDVYYRHYKYNRDRYRFQHFQPHLRRSPAYDARHEKHHDSKKMYHDSRGHDRGNRH